MKISTVIAIAICLLLRTQLSAQAVNVTISSPTRYQISDSMLSINTVVGSTHGVASVVASVGSHQITLTATNGVNFQGFLPLSGLSQDTLVLVVLVTGTLGDTVTAQMPFIYDKAPTLVLPLPLNNSVARPTVPVRAGCGNKDTCTIEMVVVIGSNPQTYYDSTFVDSVNTILDLSAVEGNSANIRFTITDKRGVRATLFGGNVFVESSPYLTKVFEAGDAIIDFNFNKALVSGTFYANPNDPSATPTRIFNVQTLDSVIIPSNAVLQTNKANLTPFGAIFNSSTQLLDWNAGSLVNVGGGTFQTAGNYAILSGNVNTTSGSGSGLYIRDLAAQTYTQIVVNQTAGINNGCLTTNGFVAFELPVGSIPNVWTYQSGTKQTITTFTQSNTSIVGISTDGANILYNQKSNTAVTNTLHYYNGLKDTVLSNLGTSFPAANTYLPYQSSNNIIVYPSTDIQGLTQFWEKDTLGNFSKISNFTLVPVPSPGGPAAVVKTTLDLLNAKGDFTFFRDTFPAAFTQATRRWMRMGSQFQNICANFGTTYFRDSSWYIAIGRDLFKINMNIVPDSVTPSSVSVKKDSAYAFSQAGFISNFTGSGQLINVMVTSLPANGSLTFNGVRVTLNQVIPRSSLGQLMYQPSPGFIGVDSFFWNGSNGIAYTPSATSIAVKITTISAPPVPVLSALAAGYCANLGIQKLKITNLPASASGITVVAKLDTTTLPVAADSTVAFNVSGLSVGTHNILVVFTNTAGSDTTREGFTITAPVTPIVRLNVSSNTVTIDSPAITITATAIAGGGTAPQYIFASDRGFATVLQASSASNTLTIQPATLSLGSNWVYVKMTTSDTCYTQPFGVDSVQLTRNAGDTVVIPPPQPQLSALNSTYCSNQGIQKVKIENLPAAGSGISVHAKIDATDLSIGADGSVSFNVAGLPAGQHILSVVFNNSSKSDTTNEGFTIVAAVTPVVQLRSSVNSVTVSDPAITVTATAIAGGGTAPQFIFASDRNFDDILQNTGLANTLTIQPSTLNLGVNWVYVRMTTSDSCYSVPTGTDSLQIIRNPPAGAMVDLDFPSQPIAVFPNPFDHLLSIYGLSTTKSYVITLTDGTGREILSQSVSNAVKWQSSWLQAAKGIYSLRLYDDTKGRVIGVVKLLGK